MKIVSTQVDAHLSFNAINLLNCSDIFFPISCNIVVCSYYLFFTASSEPPSVVPYGAWLVGRLGGFSAGAQYKPLSECY
jgi:hypothetical protein